MSKLKQALKSLAPYGIVDLYKKKLSRKRELEVQTSCTSGKSESELEAIRLWRKADGDNTFRINYPTLNPNSLVFDVGGFRGEWTTKIFARYAPKILIFEPIPFYFEQLNDFFAYNKKIEVFPFALGASEGEATITLAGDGSSLYVPQDQKTITVRTRKLSNFIEELGIEKIDLLKLNVEGAEYDIMKDIFEAKMVERVIDFQIQWHNFDSGCVSKCKTAQDMLAVSHECLWSFDFVWEGWSKKCLG